jgi:hypothetical protein
MSAVTHTTLRGPTVRLVSAAMAVIAFVLEKVLSRARARDAAPKARG